MKKRFFIIAFLVFIISLGCVSASDDLNDTSDVLAADEGSFSELQNMINSAGKGSTINLKTDYAYDSSFKDTGILISKPLTINGNDHTIDAKGLSRIFNVEADNVVISKLNLINGYIDDNGGAIYWSGDGGSLKDCTLEYNTALAGGAISWYGNNGKIISSTFNRNNATDSYGYGGAIKVNGEKITITDSTFYKNYALDDGDAGAISVDGDNATIKKCTFERNYANNAGGAIYWSNANGVLEDSKFIHDYSNLGGAVVHTGENSKITGCTFEECYALEGGAIAINYEINLNILNCRFNDNYAEYNSGAIKVASWGSATIDKCEFTNNRVTRSSGGNNGGAINSKSTEQVVISNSRFINNTVPYLGAAIYTSNDGQDIIKNCNFTDNTANYGAVDIDGANGKIEGCIFKDNTGRYGAADVYWTGDEGTLIDCDFKDSYAGGNGGAVYWEGNDGTLSDSTFTNCEASSLSSAGAVYWSGKNGKLSKSKFTNCKSFDGGAVRWYGDDGQISDSTFTKNSVSLNGGAIDINGDGVSVIASTFIENSALNGGAIKVSGNNVNVDKSTFNKNNAVNGGAFNWGGNYGVLSSSNFNDNTASSIGGALYWFGDDGIIKYDKFPKNETPLYNDIAIEGSNVVVIPVTIEITAPDVTMNYGENKNLQITLTEDDMPIANVNVLISLNKVNYTQTTNNNGKISMPINNLNSGTYNAVISYEDVTETAKITVNKLSTTLTLTAVQSGDKTAALTATISPGAADGNVVFNINGKDYTAKINNGKAIATVNNLNYGTYNVKASYAGSTNYKSSSASAKVIIEEKQLIVKAADLVKYYSGAEKFTVKVTDSDGKAQSGKSVKISINGKDYTQTTDSNGNAAVDVNLNVGVYEATATCYGQTAKATVTIKSTVEGKDITKMYKNGTQYSAAFLDSKGNPLKNADVEFKINGESYKRTTDNNGRAGMSINLNPGKYEITTKNPSTNEVHSNLVTVKSVIVENYDLTKYFKNASQYRVRILDDVGKPVKAGVDVIYNINGVFYTRQTDGSGYAQLNINLEPGTYVITSYYNGLETSNTVKVLNVLLGKDVNMKFKDGTKYEVKLLDGKGKAYPGQKIILNINGVFYERVTESDGIARLNLNLEPGTYIITAYYNGLSRANSIKIDNVLFGKDVNMQYKDGTKYEVKLIDAKGNPYPGQKIILNINGVFYERVTESDGIARLNINLNPGTYIITAYYNGLSRANKVVVNPVEEELIKYDCGNFYVSLPESATIELIEEETKAAVFEVTYDGNTFQITEDGTGIYSANSYINMITGAGGRVLESYDGWTLATLNSNYMSYKDHGGVVYGVLGPVRDVVEAICSSVEFV